MITPIILIWRRRGEKDPPLTDAQCYVLLAVLGLMIALLLAFVGFVIWDVMHLPKMESTRLQ